MQKAFEGINPLYDNSQNTQSSFKTFFVKVASSIFGCRPGFTTTTDFTLPPIGNRFADNRQLQEAFEQVGIIETLHDLPLFNFKMHHADWKGFTYEELLMIKNTRGNDPKSEKHWRRMREHADEALKILIEKNKK